MAREMNNFTSCKFTIEGLDCADCAAKLERDLQDTGGISNVSINFVSGTVEVGFNPIMINQEGVQKRIEKSIEHVV